MRYRILAEIYNYRSIRWKAKKLTPMPTKVIPQSIKNIFRKIPIIKQLAYELEIVFYKYSKNSSKHLISIVIPARNEAGNKELHQLFKKNNEFISIKVRGNTWEPITRWLRLDSRIFRETTSKARITLCAVSYTHLTLPTKVTV